MTNNKAKTVLICPLNWGLGHASRDVVIIKNLTGNGFNVIIAADKSPLAFLKKEFPAIPHIKLPSAEIKYPKGKLMALQMLLSAPKLLWAIYREHRQLRKILREQKIDLVISDNRFGLWNKKVYSVFISHQIEIQTPAFLSFAKPIINYINRWFINKYDVCWVPDLPAEDNLAGPLSHLAKMPVNCRYVGLISRFEFRADIEKKHDIAVILSGPEPQRSIFEQLIVKQISGTNYRAVVVRGKPNDKARHRKNKTTYINHLKTSELQDLILSSGYIISRSGYSSIMDYIYLKKNAILVATPGQTEQEYLAKRMKKKKWFYSTGQDGFNLKKAIEDSKSYQVPNLKPSNNLLQYEIGKLKEKLYL